MTMIGQLTKNKVEYGIATAAKLDKNMSCDVIGTDSVHIINCCKVESRAKISS